MDKFKNKFRIDSTRLKWWDYGSNAAYFVTICTQNMIHYFGEVVPNSNEVCLSKIGAFVESCWYEIPKHFPFVELGAFVVMPNHIHGIIIINKPSISVETRNIASSKTKETQNVASLQRVNKFGVQSQNLASIVRGYKIGVTKNARLINAKFSWQPRFYDHIIRSDVEYEKIYDYIKTNPANWESDRFCKNLPLS